MEAEFNHLNHATWECKYHVVLQNVERKMRNFLGHKFLARRVLRHDRWPGRGK